LEEEVGLGKHVTALSLSYMRYEVLAAMKVLMFVFWVEMPSGLVGRY
jgi:hypothetical protein